MKLNRIAAAAAVAAIAVGTVSGFAVSQHGTVAVTQSSVALAADSQSVNVHAVKSQSHIVAAHAVAAHVDPSLAWLESRGGQAQVTFNNEVSTLAGDLVTEAQAPTVANHLVFEADARVVRAEAEKILHTRALLPTHNRAAYKTMLKDFITVANLLQPGPDYGTTPQDDAAWNTAMKASDITVW
jgi:hypothetical protein